MERKEELLNRLNEKDLRKALDKKSICTLKNQIVSNTFGIKVVSCSKCKNEIETYSIKGYKYCPSCGAKVVGIEK